LKKRRNEENYHLREKKMVIEEDRALEEIGITDSMIQGEEIIEEEEMVVMIEGEIEEEIEKGMS
jgi:hypothetical protein